MKLVVATENVLAFASENLLTAAARFGQALSMRPYLCLPSRRSMTLRVDCRGQATAEYALVILGAAAIAMLFVAWATDTKRIGTFFNAVMKSITKLVT